MKKSFLSIVFIVLFSVFIPFSTLADPSSIGYGGSTTTSPDTYGHWVANRDGSWSFISNETSTPLYGWIVVVWRPAGKKSILTTIIFPKKR